MKLLMQNKKNIIKLQQRKETCTRKRERNKMNKDYYMRDVNDKKVSRHTV